MTTTGSSTTDSPPILYSFRRCPYAIRARLALAATQQQVQLREVKLANKPQTLLQVSPKGTVPVLVLNDDHILDESRDIMHWAISQLDSTHPWRVGVGLGDPLLERNDKEFKHWLDRYKYADRHPDYDVVYYRTQAEAFLMCLERRLTEAPWLSGQHGGALDAAIVPFVRQFAGVDAAWFEQAPYPLLQSWLRRWLSSALFTGVMDKRVPWKPEDPPLLWPSPVGTLASEARQFSLSKSTSGF